jgi:hypothetical protein
MQLIGLVHFLLNVVGLLLWLRWREEMLQSSRRAIGGTLLGTLKRAAAAPGYRWSWLGALAVLVVLRALLYWHMGSALRWTPSLDVGAIVISFRSDLLSRMMLFSISSLAGFLAGFYFWLLLVSAVNRRVSDSDPLQNRVRAHLGWLERLPAWFKLLLPFLLTTVGWLGLGPALARLGLILPARSMSHTLQQALVIGLDAVLIWKWLIAGLLVLHLLISYVYLGHSPFWSFINATGRNLLWPIDWIPLKIGRIDLAPLAGAAVVLFLGELAARSLPALYQRLPLW